MGSQQKDDGRLAPDNDQLSALQTAVVFTLLSAYTNHGARPSNTAVGFRSQLAEETRCDSAGGRRAKGGTRNAVPAAKRRKNGMQYPTSSARIASQILPQKKIAEQALQSRSPVTNKFTEAGTRQLDLHGSCGATACEIRRMRGEWHTFKVPVLCMNRRGESSPFNSPHKQYPSHKSPPIERGPHTERVIYGVHPKFA